MIKNGELRKYNGPGGDVVVPEGVTSIGAKAFYGCSSLASISLPAGVTSIGTWAFKQCSSLVSIELPAGLTSIGYKAFEGCSSLASIELPAGLTSIGDLAFSGCSSLESIILPDGVSIGENAFEGCKLLVVPNIPEAVLMKTESKDLWLRAAAVMSSEKLGGVLRKCPKKLRPEVEQLLAARELSTPELCAQVKKYPAKLRPYLEQLICTRDDPTAAGYFEKRNRLDTYAAIHNTDADALRDSLLSDFGLDVNGRRSWPLAGSAVTAQLNSDFTLTLTDAAGKLLRSVPKKGADPAEYETAKKEFAQLKKDVVAAAKLRNDRLLREFLAGTERDAESWKKAYLGNPLLRLLARLLVWQQGGNTFTLREDGSACDVLGNDYAIGAAPVCLAHPMELPAETNAAWQSYFLDRGLKQPFEQVWEPVADADSVKPGRYDGCTVPLYALMNKEKHGIVMEGQSRITLRDCSAGLKLIEGHHDWVNNEFEITDFTYQKFTRQVNHIVVHLDKATVSGRIKKDDVSVAQWLHLFTAAQIREFIELASSSEATNCTALLLEYRNQTFPDLDPFAEFTLDL